MSAAAAAKPASQFGLPGVTRPVRNRENNDGLVTTLQAGSQVDLLGAIPFKQTDVIKGWTALFNLNPTWTAGGGTFTTSAYFPWNIIGPTKLNLQGQFNLLDVENGIDLFLFQTLRPMVNTSQMYSLNGYTNLPTAYSNQANLISASNYTNASTSIQLPVEIPAGMWFEYYYPLDVNGTILGQMGRTFVSPQYMAGTSRIVTPQVRYNAQMAAAGVTDQTPVSVAGGTPTYSGTSTLNIQRHGYYQPQGAADSMPVHNWQLTRQTRRYSLSGVSTANLNVPLNGQILMLYVRLFDPSASSNLGAPIALSNVTECDVVYGSGLYRAQDRAKEMQAGFVRQHPILITNGVMAWDFGLDDLGYLTNAYALNTMNTSGIQVQLTFSGTQSSTAYAVVGVEALTYVEA